MGGAGGRNSWERFVSCFLLSCMRILAWNKGIYKGIFTPKQILPMVTVWNSHAPYTGLKLEWLALEQQGHFYLCVNFGVEWQT